MEQPRTPKDRFPIYPFLFAIYPILFLYAKNLTIVSAADVFRPGAAAIVLALILLIAARLLMRNWGKAGILTSVVLLLFFSYGHVVDVALGVLGGGFRPGLLLFPLWMLIMAAASVLLLRTRKQPAGSAALLRAMAIALTLFPVAEIALFIPGSHYASAKAWDRYVARSTSGPNALRVDDPAKMPDIYYIILDAYSRADFLKESEGFDNSEFINFLKEKGFYVAEQSRSNYPSTELSIPSSLNMDYIDTLAAQADLGAPSSPERMRMFSRPVVVQLLKRAGYTIVEAPSLFQGYELAAPDITFGVHGRSSFELSAVFTDSTMLRILNPRRGVAWHELLLRSLDSVADVPRIGAPTFTLAHVTITHHPFYFRADGSINRPVLSVAESESLPYEEYTKLYVDSIKFVNSRMKVIIQEILEKSARPPIIIVQGDHGRVRWSHNQNTTKILNAYYLPGGAAKLLYPAITPVNTFRLGVRLLLWH